MAPLCLLLACGAGRPSSPRGASPPELLVESWKAYASRFIQDDGRVIDHRAGGISTSEGQAYAMLRAVWIGDRATFDKTWTWAVNNLNSGVRDDRLWAWKWGQDPAGKWRVLDRAFATDADQDAALALILAYKAWNEPRYLSAAQATLADLWERGTVKAGARRFLLAGDSLCKGSVCRVNPSYYAPYAWRIFARYDPRHNWKELADSAYPFLEEASRLAATRLPPDWLYLDTATGSLRAGDAKESSFSYDAFRTFWRVALDYELFREPRAARYLEDSLAWLAKQWKARGKLPAVIAATGHPRAEYESLEMLAGLQPALRIAAPEIAPAVYARLKSAYSAGAWGERESYYLQNWAWFGAALQLRYLEPLEQTIR